MKKTNRMAKFTSVIILCCFALVLTSYVTPMGADHLPAAMAFLAYLSSAEAQTAVAQYNLFQGTKYAPVRTNVATDQLSTDQQQGLELVRNIEEAILPFWATMPRQMFGTVEL